MADSDAKQMYREATIKYYTQADWVRLLLDQFKTLKNSDLYRRCGCDLTSDYIYELALHEEKVILWDLRKKMMDALREVCENVE